MGAKKSPEQTPRHPDFQNVLGSPPFPCAEGMCSSAGSYPGTRPLLSRRDGASAILQFPPATFFQFENPDYTEE